MFKVPSFKPSASLNKSINSLMSRSIHVEPYSIKNQHGRTGAIILDTHNDQMPHETKEAYLVRSKKQLTGKMPEEWSGSEVLMLRVSQSVINEEEWKNQSIYKTLGHIESGIFVVDGIEEPLQRIEGTLLSKTGGIRTPFRSDSEIDQDIITSKSQSEKNREHGGKEYFIFIPREYTNIDIEILKQRIMELKEESKPYALRDSACVHADYYALVGEKLTATISPQTAATRIVEKIVEDQVLLKNLTEKMKDYGFSRPANQIQKGLDLFTLLPEESEEEQEDEVELLEEDKNEIKDEPLELDEAPRPSI